MKKIAILTSGGDSQGMNTAVRAVAKTAMSKGMEVFGIKRGYKGMLEDQIFQMSALDVSGIADHGGTILLSARLSSFKDPEVRAKAAENLKKRGIEGLVVIGGDGSFHGAHYLYEEHGIKTIGIPGTIDNDIAGTDYTIGYDTALNIILDAISKLKDTATSHERTYLIEVMGRNCGDLALYAAIAGGASGVMIPEVKASTDDIAKVIRERRAEGKLYDIIVVAEGAGNILDIEKELAQKIDTDIRVTILGHVQRGGAPTANDRILATKLGVKAVELLIDGEAGLMVGMESGKVTTHKLSYAWENYSKSSEEDYKIATMLSL
ncbi:6-phosphofructokinase [Leptotrichia sp. oral taxon 221]|jgi:6-phosphofructokinase|uniref:6-phosphofructokinase n=1 Tax=Leptotrichia sp. oral taxon 221 TaxID=712362 RepID=UPI001B8C3B76|nr:6-phosphofructokinase [Leptotrichia sp. oral taxon 221]QUB96533.1 6-phosphofructokinase [Leptotrichia sp. oral taxon 221]